MKSLLGRVDSATLEEEEEAEDVFWETVRDHLERRLLSRVFEKVAVLAPDFASGDDDLRSRLSRLRFLKLEHLGVATDGSKPGAEWEVAQLELQRVAEARSVSEMQSARVYFLPSMQRHASGSTV